MIISMKRKRNQRKHRQKQQKGRKRTRQDKRRQSRSRDVAKPGGWDLNPDLYTQHFSWALAKAVRFGVSDPESVASDAILKAMEVYAPHKGTFKAICRKILVCACCDAYSKEARERSFLGQFPDDSGPVDPAAPNPAAQLERRELGILIESAISTLNPQHQQVIRLAYEEELSIKEIASRL